MLRLNAANVLAEFRLYGFGKHGATVDIAFALPDHNEVLPAIEILHPQLQAFCCGAVCKMFIRLGQSLRIHLGDASCFVDPSYFARDRVPSLRS